VREVTWDNVTFNQRKAVTMLENALKSKVLSSWATNGRWTMLTMRGADSSEFDELQETFSSWWGPPDGASPPKEELPLEEQLSRLQEEHEKLKRTLREEREESAARRSDLERTIVHLEADNVLTKKELETERRRASSVSDEVAVLKELLSIDADLVLRVRRTEAAAVRVELTPRGFLSPLITPWVESLESALHWIVEYDRQLSKELT
jgi:hypothetical protein